MVMLPGFNKEGNEVELLSTQDMYSADFYIKLKSAVNKNALFVYKGGTSVALNAYEVLK
jgi:hypothetical protein